MSVPEPCAARVGVLIAQQGTPRAPTPSAVRDFVAEFLTDPRVVDSPRLLWWLALRLFVLPRRSVKMARAYGTIWTAAGSPLLASARAQEAGLGRRLGDAFRVVLGMRYGKPGIADAVAALQRAGCERILVFPLFPQFSASTTGSVYEAVFRTVSAWRSCPFPERCRRMPTLRCVPPYFADPLYLNALRAVITEAVADEPSHSGRFLFSFHGLPRRYTSEGDPYGGQCSITASRLAAALGLRDGLWSMGFQSRFGRGEWLRPYTGEVLSEWGRQRTDRLHVVCPGFTADCLETLYELGMEGARRYAAAGGEGFHLVPCLNDHPAWLDAMASIVRRETAGWI